MAAPSISTSSNVNYGADWKLVRQFVQICLVAVVVACMMMGFTIYSLMKLDEDTNANHRFGVGNRIVSCHILEKSGDPTTPECAEVLGK